MPDLKRTIQGLYDHLAKPGVVAFDTHFTKKGFVDGHRGEDVFDDGRVMGARLSVSKREGDIGELSFSYLIKGGDKTRPERRRPQARALDHGTFSGPCRKSASSGRGPTWICPSKAKEENQFRDVVFVGCRPGISSVREIGVARQGLDSIRVQIR